MADKRPHIYFRADACPTIGYGHFVRTLALADMVGDGFCRLFVTRRPTPFLMEQASAVCDRVICLTDNHFDEFLELLKVGDIVVLDNYFFDTDYQRRIRARGCWLVAVDDMHDKHYVADVLINHVLTDAKKFSVEPYTRLCLGLDWSLVRREFFAPLSAERSKGHVVVAFGGVDCHNITGRVVELLLRRGDVARVTAVVGDAYAFADSLSALACEKLDVKRNLSAADMAALFRSAEFAVLPASTVAIEAIVSGCAVMAGYYVDNQVECHDQLSQDGYIVPLGDLLGENIDQKILPSKVLPQKFKLNTYIAGNYRELFETLALRTVDYVDLTPEESRAVWELRNGEQIRQFMASTEPFAFESHLSFVERLKTIYRDTDRYWAVFRGQRLVGGYSVVHIDNETHSADRGLFLDPLVQGGGLAARVEKLLDDTLRDEFGLKQLDAQVLISNTRSLNYHLKIGYKIVNQDDRFYYLSRQLR